MQQHPFLKFFLIFISIICTQPFAEAQIYIDEWEKGTKNLEQIVQETEVIFDTRGRGKHTGYKQFKRWENLMNYLVGPSGKYKDLIIANKSYRKFAKAK